MSKMIEDAWDALPPVEDFGEVTYEQTPEVAALRALFGTSAFKLLNNAGCPDDDREIDAVAAVQNHVAKAYLFAREADRSKPIERCLFCGTALTPGRLIGNALANGAMPKMAEQAIKSMRMYTDELGALRKRVAELEALNEAGARAVDALEGMQINTMAGLVDVWRSGMSDEQRLGLARQCCRGCGSLDTSCQCENDE